MAHHLNEMNQGYEIASMFDYSQEQMHQGLSSHTSSPSPVMWQMSGSYMQPSGGLAYPGAPQYSYYESLQPTPVVEFTDLTAPYSEDGRRKRTQVKDKQAISSMHMRRRAQNRASQRAFRERKEKHAQDLQGQLDELQVKHKALEDSYTKLGSTNQKLVSELKSLRKQIERVQATQAADSLIATPGSLEDED